jgi:methionyl-tRNA formyltransferase
MRYAFAGDRDISVKVLTFLIDKGHAPLALLLSGPKRSSHAHELSQLANLPQKMIFEGINFNDENSIAILESLELDYIIGIHFPYIISQRILNIPAVGFINLHPAYLPYNRGWHTPSWAIMDGTKYGATLHFMDSSVDEGDIINQKECLVLPFDTANSLYQRVKQVELEVFQQSLPDLVSLNPPRKKQLGEFTAHSKADLASVQQINLQENINAADLINKIRALTTNDLKESSFFMLNNKKYFVRIDIIEESNNG